MGIQNWSEDVIVVDLSPEPGIADELRDVLDGVRELANCDVVIDFVEVDIITSSSLSALLRLCKLLGDMNQSLILCSVAPATKKIFITTGIEDIFEFADDKFTALASLQLAN